MSQAGLCRVYEQEAVRSVTGQAIRPGGLALTGRILDRFPMPAGARVLDVGCGTGATAAYLQAERQINALGLDPSARLLLSARPPASQLPLLQAIGEQIPLADGLLAAVLAECSLSLMFAPDKALAEFNRVLRTGGRLILSDLYVRNPAAIPALRRLPLDCCLSRAMTCPDIAVKLEAQGFELLWWEDQSAALKYFTGQLIFSHGSLAEFWDCTTGSQADTGDIQRAVAQARPGYLALLARKKEKV